MSSLRVTVIVRPNGSAFYFRKRSLAALGIAIQYRTRDVCAYIHRFVASCFSAAMT